MATMVKEKPRGKKKTKQKVSLDTNNDIASKSTINKPLMTSSSNIDNKQIKPSPYEIDLCSDYDNVSISLDDEDRTEEGIYQDKIPQESSEQISPLINNDSEEIPEVSIVSHSENVENLIKKSDNAVIIPREDTANRIDDQTNKVTNTIYPSLELLDHREETNESHLNLEDFVMPSAPIIENDSQAEIQVPILKEDIVKPRVACLSLDELLFYCGGEEMAEVKAMSDREEAIVEAGPMCGPEHPLVDLLSTFRSSLIALEGERMRIIGGYVEEKKLRSGLWYIQKWYWTSTEKCPCGADVTFKASYEQAELLREKLPVAKLRLEGLLRDVQDSYCHHQHSALLAHSQIEELISETVQGSKQDIREALSLVLQALRLSDSAPAALAAALQRWATVLAAAVVDDRDLRQLLFLFHHLFRQSRSVLWASEVIHMSVESAGWARSVAILELLLSTSKRDIAIPCSEDMEEAWEELDRHGSGAVGDGTLRERDLLALLKAFPLHEIAARPIVQNIDVTQVREDAWLDTLGGAKVLKACQCTRLLIAALRHGSDTHPNYARLRAKLRDIAGNTLHALSVLHIHSGLGYQEAMLDVLTTELQACFVDAFQLFNGFELHKLPASLLSADVAKEYCNNFITYLHEKSPREVPSLGIELPVLSCESRVRIVTQVAIDRNDDHELANIVMKFLLQTAIKRNTSKQCEGTCTESARDNLSRVLEAHPYLCAIALHQLADISQTDQVGSSAVKILQAHNWRPTCSDIHAILEDWSRRCPNLLQQLLLELDYTPYVGLSLDVQTYIGTWLCDHITASKSPSSSAEWAWSVLRKLRVHRTSWHVPPGDAPVVPSEPVDSMSMAFSLLYSLYGHCIPVICSEGVSLLCKLAPIRPREAVHCLANIMLVLTHSPESIVHTPKFAEMFNILLSSGPSLVQRAFGRGGVSGSELLLRLILAHLAEERCGDVSRSALLTAWLYSLWQPSLPVAAHSLADVAALATRDWPYLDAHATRMLQEQNAAEYVNAAVRNANVAPLLCECVLRAWHTQREAGTPLYPRLLLTLHAQRAGKQRIHVDKAIQQIGATLNSEELCIYRAANASLYAPTNHPSHLTLWRLFMHLYLQRTSQHVSEPPVGVLFFSGIKKSRTLNQIKRRMQDTIVYHTTEVATLKTQLDSKPQEKSIQSQAAPNSPKSIDDMLPTLSIIDLTGESQVSSGLEVSDSESEMEPPKTEIKQDNVKNNSIDVKSFILYHESAVKLLREYLQWLEEGEQVRAFQHHADIARFIPEQALETAWKHTLFRETPAPSAELDEFPLPQFISTPEPPPSKTPYRQAVDFLKKINHRSKKCTRTQLKSLEVEVTFSDSRSLTNLVDKHLADIEKLSGEWYSDVSRVSELDARLWELVVKLRVPRQLSPIRLQCPNKCKALTVFVPHQEWRIAVDVERGVEENRRAARKALYGLSRPRPRAARLAAALHTIARRLRSGEAVVRVVERLWQAAASRGFARCPQAHALVTALVEQLAERWICHDGRLVVELLTRWCRSGASPLQQSLCGALVSPRRLPSGAVASLYVLLLNSKLPSHTAFSYLSKFELTRWSEPPDGGHRRKILDALLTAVQRFGVQPASEHSMLVELLGLHSCALIDARELSAHVAGTARASVKGAVPPPYWSHVTVATEACATNVPMDQLGHLLRELGVIWWDARTSSRRQEAEIYATYAPYIARLLHTIQRAFVASAMRLSYEPAMVSWYAWGAAREAWSPWVSPVPAPPLLPLTTPLDAFTPMLRHFLDGLHQVMVDCPGSECHLLQQTFEWCVSMYVSTQTDAGSQESRAQASALLVELANLPWSEHQWFFGNSLQVAMQISKSTDKELTAWCCSAWADITATTLLRESNPDHDIERTIAPKLATLLYLFTGSQLQHSTKILEEATRLPWRRLPEPALDEALETFFRVHHSIMQPYHELPQFRLLLFASELCVLVDEPRDSMTSHSLTSRRKRSVAVSQWVRAAAAPHLVKHVRGHSSHLLNVLTQLASNIEGSEGEMEELLSRSVVIMCIEPAATEALPVWIKWVSGSPARMIGPCLSAAASLTVFKYFAPLADAAAKAHLLSTDSSGWNEICDRWSSCPWREVPALISRCCLHAAYAVALQHGNDTTHVKYTIPALQTAEIHFVNEEPIVAVWICYACRAAQIDSTGEVGNASRALLASWAEPQRRSLLKVVTMSADTDRPTARHRLLCRYAQYILSPSKASAQAYEAACASTLSPNTDLATWAKAAHPRKLPRLAMRLFPQHELHFKKELDLLPEENA